MIRHLTIPIRTKANIFRRLSILFRPQLKTLGTVSSEMNKCPYGGAAGYRPRVQSAYYMRVYRYIWQASLSNIRVLRRNS